MAATGTTTQQPTESTENLTDRLRSALARLTNQQKILLMVAVAAIIALAVASSTWLKQADYRILFSNISERDGGAIIAALEQMNVPYRFSESGRPSSYQVRVSMKQGCAWRRRGFPKVVASVSS